MHASSYSACDTEHFGNDILGVSGVRIGTIREASRAEIDDPLIFSAIRAIRKNAQLDLTSCYVDGSNMLDAYCSTLCGNTFNKQYEPPTAEFADFEVIKCAPLKFLDLSLQVDTLEPGELQFLNYGYAYFKTCPFFTPHEGYLGFGPSGTRHGDDICVFLGCEIPLILRSSKEGT